MADSINITIGTDAQLDVTYKRRETVDITINVFSDAAKTTPFDLTGYSVYAEVREEDGSTLLLDLLPEISADPTDGIITMNAVDVTESIEASRYRWDLMLLDPDDAKSYPLSGWFLIDESITDPTFFFGTTPTSYLTFYGTYYYPNQPDYLIYSNFTPTAGFYDNPNPAALDYVDYLEQYEELYEEGSLHHIDLERGSNETKSLFSYLVGDRDNIISWQASTAYTIGSLVRATVAIGGADGWLVGWILESTANRNSGATFDATEATFWEVSIDVDSQDYRICLDHLRRKWLKRFNDEVATIIPDKATELLAGLGTYADGAELTGTDLTRANDNPSSIADFSIDSTFPVELIDGCGDIEASYPGLKVYAQYLTPEVYVNTESYEDNWEGNEVPRLILCTQYWTDTGTSREVIPINTDYYFGDDDDGEQRDYEYIYNQLVIYNHHGYYKTWWTRFGQTQAAQEAEVWDSTKPLARVMSLYQPEQYPLSIGFAEYSLPMPTDPLGNVTLPFPVSLLPETILELVRLNGKNLRFYNELGQRLAIDPLSVTGEALDTEGMIWYKIPIGVCSFSKIRVYINNSWSTAPADSTYGQYNAYEDSLLAFYPDGLGNDRTRNALNLTPNGATLPTVGGIAGPLEGLLATALNGSDQYGVTPISWTSSRYMHFALARTTLNSADQAISSLSVNNSTDNYSSLRFSNTGDEVSIVTRDVSARVTNGGAYSLNTWHSLCSLWNIASQVYAGIDGVFGSIDTAGKTPVNMDRLSIGARLTTSGAITQPLNGDVSLNMIRRSTQWGFSWFDYQHRAYLDPTFYTLTDSEVY